MNFILKKHQEVSFFLALGVYALFGSPTPDALGWAELLLAGLLLYSIRVNDIRKNLLPFSALVFGLSVPVFVSLISGKAVVDIIRDIIPFLFLFLPFFYGWVVRENPIRFLWALACVGFVFSLRTIWVYRDVMLSPALWGQGPPADLLYLANSPEVLFSAIFCLLCGGQFLFSQRKALLGVGLVSLSFAPVVAMALMMQRAGLGFYLLNGLAGVGCLLYFYPKKAVIAFAVCLLAGYFLWPFISIVGQSLLVKTELVGFNSRVQEWAAVIDVLTGRWTYFLFGEGWGGRLENPAVGGLSVNYTHSLISSLLLKTGVLGGFIILSGVLKPLVQAADAVRGRFLLFSALLSPFLISTFLYASYKSLGFGLILLAFSSSSSRKLEKNPVSVP